MCLECRSKTKLYNTKASAIKAWNTRKPMERIAERLEEIEEYTNDFRVVIPSKKAIEIVKEEGGLNE